MTKQAIDNTAAKSASFTFGQLDPRPVGKEANEQLFAEHKDVLGIEVTVPALAAQCNMGNLDHHGPEDSINTPSACVQAMVCIMPLEGSALVTVRCDADSVCAMAVLASRAERRYIDGEIVGQVDRLDRLGPKSGVGDHRVYALGRVAADHKRSMEERVMWIQDLLEGKTPQEEIDELYQAREAEFTAAKEASKLQIDGDIAVVVSSHRFATQLGYEVCPIVVAQNPQMQVDFCDPSKGTYNKFTICKFDSYVSLDLEGVTEELNELEQAEGGRWGGQSNIKGSPQGISSTLELEQVVQVVKKYYDSSEK